MQRNKSPYGKYYTHEDQESESVNMHVCVTFAYAEMWMFYISLYANHYAFEYSWKTKAVVKFQNMLKYFLDS